MPLKMPPEAFIILSPQVIAREEKGELGADWNRSPKVKISLKSQFENKFTTPEAPIVIVTAQTTDSITIKLIAEKEPTPIQGFTVHYKPESGDWTKKEIGFNKEEYTLTNLLCALYVTAYNRLVLLKSLQNMGYLYSGLVWVNPPIPSPPRLKV